MMKKTLIMSLAVAFVFSSMLMMASCAKKQVKVDEGAKPSAPAQMEKKGGEGAPKMGDDDAARRAEAERQARLRELERAQKLRGEIQVFESEHIYFDFDKSELKEPAKAVLIKKAGWLRENPKYMVRIEGHCDERGTNEYNLALGERRANAAWKFMNALGVSGDRLSTISYGEERPADPGHKETAWSKNRRDEFKLIK
ncbi:MAG: peptidoglycan-associated lipoprotein Pal [Pseudomonadota bacterium]